MTTAVVFVGGPDRRPQDVEQQLEGLAPELVVAVDSGLHLAQSTLGTVDVVVGDMDSVDAGALDAAASSGSRIVRHPVDKERTDLELALDEVVALGCARAVVLGAEGGRMDHLLAGALLLGSPRYASLEIEAWLGGARLVPVHSAVEVHGERGQLLSLLALHGPALGVSTSGLRWPVRGETLSPGSSRGVSNEMLGSVARITLDDGALVAVLPDKEHR